MRRTLIAATLLALGAATPVLATDGNNGGNAEGLNWPVPNRGLTSGGPAHDLNPQSTGTVRGGNRSGSPDGNVDQPARAAPNSGQTTGGPRY